jgi:putative ABC transport system permease protein
VKWGRNLSLSVRALSRAPLRTGLSAAGVAVGIAAVVMLVGAGAGAERTLQRALDRVGRNLLVINPVRTETGALRGASRYSGSLTVSDWKSIVSEIPDLLHVAPAAERPMQVRRGGNTSIVTVIGTSEAFQHARKFPLLAGRFVEADDENRRVAVVGPQVVEDLFAGESPLGETLLIGKVPFRIVGVTQKKGVTDGGNEDDLIFVPLAAAMNRLFKVESLDRIWVQATAEESLPDAQAAITELLLQRHRDEDFTIQDQTAMARAQREAGAPLSRLVRGLAGLALGLGGVGLLAVCLLSVRERYGEIGLRLAVGGLPRDILLQFFTEATLISALGGLLGVAIGAAGIFVGSSLTRWPMLVSFEAVVYPLASSVAIAIVFGAYPALRAARLDPIVALNSK